MNEKVLALAVMARDEASRTFKKIESSLDALISKFKVGERAAGAFNNILRGIGQGIGIGVFFQLQQVMSRLVGLIPSLVSQGQNYAATVDNISDVTGATAQQSSILLGVFRHLGISTDTLGMKTTRLANAVINSEKEMNKLGVTTRDSNGKLLNSVEILDNVRSALSKMSDGTAKQVVLQKLMGRGASELADFLALTDEQIRLIAQDALEMGLILDEAGRQRGEAVARTFNRLGNAIQGVANTIFLNVAPALIQLVDGLANFVKANAANIAAFASQVVGFIFGLISALTGAKMPTISFAAALGQVSAAAVSGDEAMQEFAGGAGRAGKAAKDAARKQKEAAEESIKAIDAQVDTVRRLDEAQEGWFRRQIRRLQTAIDLQLRGMDTEDRNRDAARRSVEINRRIEDSVDDVTRAKQRLADAQAALNDAQRQEPDRRDRDQEGLDEREFQLSLAEAQQRLAEAQESGDSLAIARAQLSLDQLVHSREQALERISEEERRAASERDARVSAATEDVRAAEEAVTEAVAAENAARQEAAEFTEEHARDARRRELQGVQDTIARMEESAETWSDKKAALDRFNSLEARYQSELEAAQKAGDTQRVADLQLLLDAARTTQERLQQQIRNEDRLRDLDNQKKTFEDIKEAAAEAFTGAGGVGASAGAAGGVINSNFGKGGSVLGAIADTIQGLTGEEGSMTKAFADGKKAGEEMAKSIKGGLDTIHDVLVGEDGKGGVLGGLGAAVGAVNSLQSALNNLVPGQGALLTLAILIAPFNPLLAAGIAVYAGIRAIGDTQGAPPRPAEPGKPGENRNPRNAGGFVPPGWAPTQGGPPGPVTVPKGARASGGPVWPGTWLVGERGPELVHLNGYGSVSPNVGGVSIAPGAIVINGAGRNAREIARELMGEMQREMTRNRYSTLRPR